MAQKPYVIGLVGVCGSGKTTLKNLLEPYGFNLRHIAQEHSYVQTMWKQLTHPDVLIFLDASFPETIRRRNLNWTVDEYNEQHRRLAHARQNADFYLMTDGLTPEEVLSSILEFLHSIQTT
jgi:deoxyadenosine/deoxycytidine kinase